MLGPVMIWKLLCPTWRLTSFGMKHSEFSSMQGWRSSLMTVLP